MPPRLIYVPTGENDIRDQFLRDIRLGAIDAGLSTDPSVTEGSDWFLLATAVDNAMQIALGNIESAADDSNMLDCGPEQLERLRIADGTPEAVQKKSRGRIRLTVYGNTTIALGQPFVYPTGQRGTVAGTYINPADGAEIDVIATDPGEAGNLAAGSKVTFSPAVVNVNATATVAAGAPLAGGLGVEGTEAKRRRCLDARANRPSGGNWAYIRQVVLDTMPGIQDCYVYPAIGGPGSIKVVPVRSYDVANKLFSRVVGTADLETIRGLLWGSLSGGAYVVVQAAVAVPTNVSLLITIPASAQSGGSGNGWADSTTWPILLGGDNGSCRVTSVDASGINITVSALTTAAPVAGKTFIAWWSVADMRFYQRLVTSAYGSAGAWVLTVDAPLLDSFGNIPVSGDFISPVAKNMDAYGAKWVSLVGALGPGENTADADRLPNSLRHPLQSIASGGSINSYISGAMSAAFSEITGIAYGALTVSAPVVPSLVSAAPNILTANRFGIYSA